MAELASVKADARGRFSLKASAPAQGPRLVRVTHGGINYYKMAPPGTTSLDIDVYDVATKLEGVNGTARVMRIQTSADGGALQFVELYAVTNASRPPRTLAAENSFEIALPEAAVIDGSDAQGPNGQPLPMQPAPVAGKKGLYTFSFALKPGETRFQVAYHIPYPGTASVTARMTRGFEHFVVVLPASMKWEAKKPALFNPMKDQPGTNVEVASNVKAGDDIAFTVSGAGAITQQQQAADDAGGGDGGGGDMGGAQQQSRPGGGLGAPIDAPDALERFRWIILGMLGVMLTGGAYLTVSRAAAKQPASGTIGESGAVSIPFATAPMAPATVVAANSNPLLDAMKEELFQLEIDRQKGLVGDDEYRTLKSALDHTLARALSREKRS
jgi:hypothetical protein